MFARLSNIKKISLILCVFLSPSIFAKKVILEPLLDGYYPPYPQVTIKPPFTAEQVARGEYLAKASDCIACHTNVKLKVGQFAGGLPIRSPFGTFYSSNITPDKETGIGKWTEAQFIRALRQGLSADGSNHFPVFPYMYFANLSDQDAKDLYA